LGGKIQSEAIFIVLLKAEAGAPIRYQVTLKLSFTAFYFRQFYTYGVNKKDYAQKISEIGCTKSNIGHLYKTFRSTTLKVTQVILGRSWERKG
jgi:hypothetical protein